MVVDVIKTAFDVPFHKPFRPCEGSFYLPQTGVTAAVWPEPVGMLRKGVGDTMRSPEVILKNLESKTKDKSYRFERLYRNLYNPEFYLLEPLFA